MYKFLSSFLLFLAVALLLRVFSLFNSVFDHDESTYIVIADNLLRGHTYLRESIDVKPIGIFLIYAAWIKLFGGSILGLRILAACFIALTATCLYWAKKAEGQATSVGIAAGLSYSIMCSMFLFYGLSPNTELFYVALNSVALVLILQFPRAYLPYGMAGLFLGMGFVIKYTVAFDALAFGLFIGYWHWQNRQNYLHLLGRWVLLLAGFMVPLLLVYFWYQQRGMGAQVLEHTFGLSKAYAAYSNNSVGRRLIFFLDYFLRFSPLNAAFIWIALRGPKPLSCILGLLWALGVLVAIQLQGNAFGHYMIQLMAPVCYLGSEFFSPDFEKPQWMQRTFKPRVAWSALGLLLIISLVLQKRDCWDKPDYPLQVAQYLGPQLQPQDRIFLGNFHHITYHLLGQTPPTPYVHRSLLWEKRHQAVLKIDLPAELQKIEALKPRFVVLQKPFPEDPALESFLSSYRAIKTWDKGEIVAFERK
jgi:4-amino-4-deoxy-L-arabinose transferase-like glycosyltransferase